MMEESPPSKLKHMAIGGVIGGVLSSIPCVSTLNCCFCLLVGLGSYLSVRFWLDANPERQLSTSDAALLGAGSGAIAGVITAILGAITNLILGPMQQKMLTGMMSDLDMDPEVLALMSQMNGGNAFVGLCIGLIVSPMIYGLFGSLWALAGASVMHKDRME